MNSSNQNYEITEQNAISEGRAHGLSDHESKAIFASLLKEHGEVIGSDFLEELGY